MTANVSTTYTYPGVYIEESPSLSISVSTGATAVPIFADKSGSDYPTARRFDSWLDFVANTTFSETNTLHVSLRAYFENGGGYCYVVNADAMEAEVSKFDDITLLVAAGQDIKGVVASLCKPGKSLFAILDLEQIPPTSTNGGAAIRAAIKKNGAKGVVQKFEVTRPELDENPCAAIYYPNLLTGPEKTPIEIPASAVMAGIYCSVDRARGVWKAPANISLKGGLRLKYKATDQDQGDNNKDGQIAINMIREFRNVGNIVWGARTMSTDLDWRYIPVRRLFDMAERDIKRAVRIAVFEPNTGATWTRVKAAIDNYLYNIWQMGGLMGSRPEEGYFVQVGEGITMTRDDVLNGKMIVRVGLAAVRPAEFIILQFTQEVGQA